MRDEYGGIVQDIDVVTAKDGTINLISTMEQDNTPVLTELELHRMLGEGWTKSREVKLLGITPFVDYHKAIKSGIPIDRDDKALKQYLKANPRQCVTAVDVGKSGKIIIK